MNIWQAIKKSGAGFVENDDLQGIKKLLQQWWALSDNEKTAMNHQAKACFQNNFSTTAAFSDLEKVLLEVVKNKTVNPTIL